MLAFKWLALALGVLVAIGIGAFAPMILQTPTTTGTTSSSYTTTSTHCTTSQSTSSTTTTVTATSTSATSTVGSYTYSPSSPVKVTFVQATTYQDGNRSTVSFAVSFENVGSYTVYTAAGCGSGLTASLAPGSQVLEKVASGPVCLCAEIMAPVDPGQNRTATTPGCWSGYQFLLVHPGTVQVDFVLSWSSRQANPVATSTNVTAWFTFA